AVVAAPAEFQRAALGGGGGDEEKRIRRHRRVQLGAEHFDAVVAAHQAADDVARDQLAELRAAKTRFHWVAGEGADLDHLALLRLCRHVDHDARHQISPSSRHAESVTITFTLSDQNEPSDICAIATTSPLSAMRARVATRALPARGPRCAVNT